MQMNRNAILLLLMTFVFVAGGCRKQTVSTESFVTVKTDTVKNQNNEFELTYPGKTQALSDASLAFRIAGPIYRIPVEVGQFVRKGSVLAELDPRDYRLQLNATQAEYEKIKAEAERVIELYKRGSATSNDYDKARFGLEQITRKYEAHKNALNDVVLRAPFDGYVQKKYFQVNEMVNAGTPVISFVGKNEIELVIHIPAEDYLRRERFEGFTATSEMYPDRLFPLELIGVAPKANLNQLYEMRLRLKDAEAVKPTPGMSMNVTIGFKPDLNGLVSIPLNAMFESDGKSAVWVYDPAGQTVSKRLIQPVQIKKNGIVIVNGGVRPGEVIVSAGVHSLSEGMRVRVLPQVSKTNVGGLL